MINNKWIGSVVRHGLSALGGVLVTVGVSEADSQNLVNAALPVVSGVVSYAVAQVWSIAAKKVANRF